MKKISLILLTAVLALSAVEWDTEPINISDELNSQYPVLVLDNQDKPRVVYDQYHNHEDIYELRVAYPNDWPWDEKVVAEQSDYLWWTIPTDIEVDSKGNTFVVYDPAGDIYLACDSSGEFTSTNLTNDPASHFIPVLVLDKEDGVHVAYIDWIDESTAGLTYGYFDKQGLHTQQVAEDICLDFDRGHELVVDADNIPHIFYAAESGHIYYATPSTMDVPNWWREQLTDTPCVYPGSANPLALIDAEGNFHLAYNSGNGIRYMTNETGQWQETSVSDNEGDHYPCIAMGPDGGIHMVWWSSDPNACFYYVSKAKGWQDKEITIDGGFYGYGRYFDIDTQGYGHLVYDISGIPTDWVYYAKTTEPLSTAIAERPPQLTPLCLEVRESAVHFSVPVSGTIRLNLYDASGRLVSHLTSGSYPAGQHAIPISTTGLSSGVYFVRAEIAGRSASAKFVLTR